MTCVDILIVGAGPYGTAVMGELSRCSLPPDRSSLSILVVEKAEISGPGTPFSREQTTPDHIANIAGGCTQITQTYIPVSERSDFLEWLRGLSVARRVRLGLEEHEVVRACCSSIVTIAL